MSKLTVDMENLTNAERKQLLKLVKKGQEEKSIFKPDKGDTYYTINYDGTIRNWRNDTDNTDNRIIKYGNAYTDKSVAERKLKDMKLWSLLWNFAEENKGEIDWSNSERDKYYIYCGNNHNWYIDVKGLCRGLTEIYFSTQEIARRAIDEIIVPYENGEL